ncbi:MAG: glutamate 5-kinase [Acidobacteria bacterium]|nr:glutamate 5-kinase [Acidobacteriota bacterium]
MQGVKRLVVKAGSNVVIHPDGTPALSRLFALMETLAAQRRAGREVLLVSSGAVGLGVQALGLKKKPGQLDLKQACAAVGQGRLMALYQEGFARLGVEAAQVLLTEEDFSNRRRYLNLRATLDRILALGAIPVINENDTVSTQELESEDPGRPWERPVFGDNDKLSALVASKMDADLLVILSDVEGLFTANPQVHPEARLVPEVPELTPEIEASASGVSSRGRGGMATKLAAARIATSAGAWVVVASGLRDGVLGRVLAGEAEGTLFHPGPRLRGRQRWIAFASAPAGRILVNPGAREALQRGKASLLSAGVTGFQGDFQRDDVVAICGEEGREFARGVAQMDREAAESLVGGAGKPRVVVHRDTLVLGEGS